uniref:PDZ domain-containing protein n=1 Tax=Canis lupus familiaris TaxID=9615 RepID=A0A8C0NQ46_CANLF
MSDLVIAILADVVTAGRSVPSHDALCVEVLKTSAGLGLSLDGGKSSVAGDGPLFIKRVYKGNASKASALGPVHDCAFVWKMFSFFLTGCPVCQPPCLTRRNPAACQTGGAAEQAGTIEAGDEILAINGKPLVGLMHFDAWNIMKSVPEGPVQLVIRKPGILPETSTSSDTH